MSCESVAFVLKSCSLIAIIAAFPACAAAQQAPTLVFDVASVRQAPNYAPPTPEDIRAGRNHLPRTRIEGDRVDISNTPMRLILATAYRVAGIYVFGESWLVKPARRTATITLI